AMEAKIARAERLEAAVAQAHDLLDARRFEDAAEHFGAILEEVPEHRRAGEGLTRARAEAEADRQRERVTDIVERARAALDDHRYALCLETLREASELSAPPDASDAIRALREAAETGLVEEEARRVARQQAEEARVQMASARADAQAEDAARLAPGIWNDAEAASAAAEADLRQETY